MFDQDDTRPRQLRSEGRVEKIEPDARPGIAHASSGSADRWQALNGAKAGQRGWPAVAQGELK